MIALESFRRFRIIDITAILILSIIWSTISLLLNKLFGPQFSYIASLTIATFLLSFTVFLVRKAGSATLFYLLGAFFSSSINDLGAVGKNKIIILTIAAILFELFFLIFKLEFKNIKLDVIIATACSSASIPILTGILLSLNTALNMADSIINLILLSFFIGILGSTLSFMFWHRLKTTKFILKFEYTQ